MKLVFLGTSMFAVPALEALHEAEDISVEAVVSRPDRPAGRGRKLRRPPVAIRASELGIPLLQPEKLREIREEIQGLSPRVMVSASYGGWLPGWFLELAPLGVVNIHPSLLPRHRGAAPVIRAIMEGDPETGVSFMVTDSGWDTGDLLRIFPCGIPHDRTAGELEDLLARKAAGELPGVLRDYSAGKVTPVPQSGEESYAEKVSAEEAVVDWTRDGKEVCRRIMAFSPVPGARSEHQGKVIKIFRAEYSEMSGRPGEIISLSPPTVACGRGSAVVTELQLQGKRRMDWRDFIRGFRMEQGDTLG